MPSRSAPDGPSDAEPARGLSRRTFLKGAGAAGLMFVAAGGVDFGHGAFGPPDAFAQGIAAGVPANNGWNTVLLWTRATPPPGYPAVDVRWTVYSDSALRQVVTSGIVSARRADNGVVKVPVGGLTPGRSYWYRMEQLVGRTVRAGTEVGRAMTLPDPKLAAPDLRIAALACQNWAHGYFSAHRYLAHDRNVDFVAVLGDAIYADVADGLLAKFYMGYVREDPTPEAKTLDDYRLNYEQYLSDANWRALRAAHPIIQVWDDHEFYNGFLGGEERNSERVRAARQAFAEYSPVQVPQDYERGLDRIIRWGRDIQLVVQDARWYARDGDRWGDAQRLRLGDSTTRRSIVLSPVVAHGRQDVLAPRSEDTVILSGDSHIQGEQPMLDAYGKYGTQFMVGAATSRGGTDGYPDWEYVRFGVNGGLRCRFTARQDTVEFLEADVSSGHGRVRVGHVFEETRALKPSPAAREVTEERGDSGVDRGP